MRNIFLSNNSLLSSSQRRSIVSDLSSLDIRVFKEKIHQQAEFLQIISSLAPERQDLYQWARSQMKSNNEAVFEYRVEIRMKENEIPIKEMSLLKRPTDFHELEKALFSTSDKKMLKIKLERLPKGKKGDHQFQYDFYLSFLAILCSEPSIRSSFRGLYEFLGVSRFGLSGQLNARKEGPIFKKVWVLNNNCVGLFRKEQVQEKWIVVGNEGVGMLENFHAQDLIDYVIFDGNYELKLGRVGTGSKFGIKVSSSARTFEMRAKNYLDLIIWVLAIHDAAKRCSALSLNRFLSGFPPRAHCQCNFLFEGEGYFSALMAAIERAQNEIFISSKIICPQILLIRPVSFLANQNKARLDCLLRMMASKGVKIYMILFNEPPKAHHNVTVMKYLTELHQNISVILSPGFNLNVSLWGFNEKLCIIDRRIAFVGGPDLSLGQWDTSKHTINDWEFDEFHNLVSVFPGKDYSNNRIRRFENIDDLDKNMLDRGSEPRLPVHSVGVKVEGNIVFDLSKHFIQTWNFLNFGKQPLDELTKKFINHSKQHIGENIAKIKSYSEGNSLYYPLKDDFETLVRMMKRATISAEEDAKNLSVYPAKVHNQSVKHTRKPCMKIFDKMVEIYGLKPELREPEEGNFKGTFICQLLRSANHWSLGLTSIEHSIHNCYLELVMSAKHFIYIENQFFISSNANRLVKNLVIEALVLRIKRAAANQERFKVMIILPLVRDLPGQLEENEDLFLLEQGVWKTISHGSNSLIEILKREINIKSVFDYVSIYGLRAHGKIKGVPKSEEIYVNSNLMIIDDNILVVGTANINDRSLLGSRDCEIGLCIEESKKNDGIIAGSYVKVSNSVRALRMRLFNEHFALEEELCLDPLNSETQKIIAENCRKNTFYYRETFKVWPDDGVRRLDMLEMFKKEKKMSYYDMLSQKIKGNAVEFPLNWMADEYLEKEKAHVPMKNFL